MARNVRLILTQQHKHLVHIYCLKNKTMTKSAKLVGPQWGILIKKGNKSGIFYNFDYLQRCSRVLTLNLETIGRFTR